MLILDWLLVLANIGKAILVNRNISKISYQCISKYTGNLKYDCYYICSNSFSSNHSIH